MVVSLPAITTAAPDRRAGDSGKEQRQAAEISIHPEGRRYLQILEFPRIFGRESHCGTDFRFAESLSGFI
jgi:hypothetical protein